MKLISKDYKYIPRRIKRFFKIAKYTRVFLYENASIQELMYSESKKYPVGLYVIQYWENRKRKFVVFDKGQIIKVLGYYERKPQLSNIPVVVFITSSFYRLMKKGLSYRKKTKIKEKQIVNTQEYIKKEWKTFINYIQKHSLLNNLYLWQRDGLTPSKIKNRELIEQMKPLRNNMFYCLLTIRR